MRTLRPRASEPWQLAQDTADPIIPVTPLRGKGIPEASDPLNMVLPRVASAAVVVELALEAELPVLEGTPVVVEEPAVVLTPVLDAFGDTNDQR
jgi:hypothetical protein